MSGATINANSQCQFGVTVTGVSTGQYQDNTNAPTSTNGGTGVSASANIQVILAPTISKAFGGSTLELNHTTTLQFAIDNPNAFVALSGVAFVDSLPAGMVVASTPGLSSTCSGTVTADAGAGTISLSGGTLAANTGCTIQVNITATVAAVMNNFVQVSFTGGGSNSGNASITVVKKRVAGQITSQ
jgi:hypothetical protein